MMRKLGTVHPSKLEHAMPPDTRANATEALKMAPNQEWVKGQAIGRITASSNYAPYNPGAADGTETMTNIAAYSGKTDAQGRVFLGEDDADSDLPTGGFMGTPEETLEAYYGGMFFLTDLVNVDAAAIQDVHGRMVMGGNIVLIPT